jgi:hypothetical protein
MPVAPPGSATAQSAQQAAAAAAEARHQELLRQLAAAEKLRQQQQAAAEAARQARDRAAQEPKPQVIQATNTAYQNAQLALADTNRRIINIHRQIVQSPLPTLQNGKPDTFFTDPTVKKEFDGYDLRPPRPLSADPSNSGEPVITPEKVDPSKYGVTGKDSTGMWGIATDQMNAAYSNAWPPRDPPSKADVANYWQSVVNANRSNFPDVNLIHPGDSLHLPGFTLPQREVVDPQERYLGKDGKPKSDWAQTFTHDVETGVVQPQDHAFRVMMSDPTQKKDALALMQQRQVELLDPANPDSKKPNAARDAAGLDAAISAANALKPQPPNNGNQGQPGGAQDPKAKSKGDSKQTGKPGDPQADANAIFTGNTGTACVPVGTPQQQLDNVTKALDAHKSDPNYATQLLAAVPQGEKSNVAQLLAERLTPQLVSGYSEAERKKVMAGLSTIADSSPQASDAIGKAIAAKLPDGLLGANDRPMTASNSFAGSLRALMLDGKGVNLTASISKELNAEGHNTARDELSKAFLDATTGRDPKDPKVAAIAPGIRTMLTNLQSYKGSDEWTSKAIQSGGELFTRSVVLAPAMGTKTGSAIINAANKAGVPIHVLSDAEFNKRFGSDDGGVTTDGGMFFPLSRILAPNGADTVVHEMVHATVGSSLDATGSLADRIAGARKAFQAAGLDPADGERIARATQGWTSDGGLFNSHVATFILCNDVHREEADVAPVSAVDRAAEINRAADRELAFVLDAKNSNGSNVLSDQELLARWNASPQSKLHPALAGQTDAERAKNLRTMLDGFQDESYVTNPLPGQQGVAPVD